MGINDGKVISIVGKDIWNHILDAVRDGTVNPQNMSDIARLLNSKVGGSHLRRKECDEAEMREILGEYYNEEMFEMSTHEAVTKLIEVMKNDSVRLFPLAKKLEGCLENVKRIVLLGSTGAGKSSLGNSLLNLQSPNGFRESEDPESCTKRTEELTGAWLGTGSLCSIVDTPGMNDSQGRDVEYIKQIVDFLKEGKAVDTFLLVRNGNNLRMDKPFKDMLKIFEIVFGESFWSNVAMSISNTRYEEEEEAKIQRNTGKWGETMKKEFPNSHQTALPSVILDSGKQKSPRFVEEAEKLWKLCSRMEKFQYKDFHAMRQELAQHKEESNHKLRQRDLEITRLTRHPPPPPPSRHTVNEQDSHPVLSVVNEVSPEGPLRVSITPGGSVCVGSILRKEYTCPLKMRFPESEDETQDILCQIDLSMKNLPESKIDLDFLMEMREDIKLILSSKAKSLPWESITFKAEALTHGSTILHYSLTYVEPKHDDQFLENQVNNSLTLEEPAALTNVEPKNDDKYLEGQSSTSLTADLWPALKSHDELKQILEGGADVNAATKQDGWSLLHDAANVKGNLRMVKLLLQHKADVNAK